MAPAMSALSDRRRGSTLPLDLCNPFDILDLQVTAAFQDFQRVFFVGEAKPFGFSDAERDDAGRRIAPGRAMRRLPVEVIANSAVAPFRRVLVERRTAIVAGGRGVCRTRRVGRRHPEVDLRHRGLAPGKGHDIGAGRGALVGKRHFRRRAESEAVAGTRVRAASPPSMRTSAPDSTQRTWRMWA